jgi:hypothetical protein
MNYDKNKKRRAKKSRRVFVKELRMKQPKKNTPPCARRGGRDWLEAAAYIAAVILSVIETARFILSILDR